MSKKRINIKELCPDELFPNRIVQWRYIEEHLVNMNPALKEEMYEAVRVFIVDRIIEDGTNIDCVISYVKEVPDHVYIKFYGENWEKKLREQYKKKVSVKGGV